MSHISENRTVISKVHDGLLKETIELLATHEVGLSVSQEIKDYSHEPVAVDCAIFTPNLPRGLGLNWKKNAGLEFKGDSWGHVPEYERLQKLILLTYQTLAVQKSLVQMGYQIDTQQPNLHTALVEGVHA